MNNQQSNENINLKFSTKLGIFFFYPPKIWSVSKLFSNGPIKVLECVDIIFLGQFDVPEHVFNIGLMVRPILAVLWLLRKKISHTKMPKNGHIYAILILWIFTGKMTKKCDFS